MRLTQEEEILGLREEEKAIQDRERKVMERAKLLEIEEIKVEDEPSRERTGRWVTTHSSVGAGEGETRSVFQVA